MMGLIIIFIEQSRVPRNAHGSSQAVLEIRFVLVQQRGRGLGEGYEGVYSVGKAGA